MFFAMSIGTVLSLVGVLYPAIVASRMQPVEAMRVEQ
jgi:ABC-type antimicrobial peptide transport system permease subunit